MKKNSINFGNIVEESVIDSIKRESLKELSLSELETLKNIKLASELHRFHPKVIKSSVVSSNALNEFYSEAALRTEILNKQVEQLNGEIRSFEETNWKSLSKIKRDSASLTSEIREMQIKNLNGYNLVHFNDFKKNKDKNTKQKIKDWKTERTVYGKYLLKLVEGLGLTLPVRNNRTCFIEKISIVPEETDFGNIALPIRQSSPMDLLDSVKPFLFTVGLKNKNSNGQAHIKKIPNCTLEVQLGNVETINYLEIQSMAQGDLWLESIEYETIDGTETITLNEKITGEKKVFFEAISTYRMKIHLSQKSFLETGKMSINNLLDKKLNEYLSGNDWSILPSLNSEEDIRIYDFSLESLKLGLLEFESFGFFNSIPLNTKNLLSVGLDVSSSEVTEDKFDISPFSEKVFVESYLRIKNSKEYFVPIPFSNGKEYELLENNSESKLRFVPDLFTNREVYFIKSAVYLTGFATFTLDKDYGLELGVIGSNPIEVVYSEAESEKHIIDSPWTTPSVSSISIQNTSSFLGNRTENTYPIGKILIQNEDEPFIVYKEAEVLAIKEDYEISLDGGVSYIDYFPSYSEFESYKSLKAGDFKIKILERESNKIYWIDYTKLREQKIDDKIKLKYRSLIFDKIEFESDLELETVLIIRSNNQSLFSSPIIDNYTLKVRSNE